MINMGVHRILIKANSVIQTCVIRGNKDRANILGWWGDINVILFNGDLVIHSV